MKRVWTIGPALTCGVLMAVMFIAPMAIAQPQLPVVDEPADNSETTEVVSEFEAMIAKVIADYEPFPKTEQRDLSGVSLRLNWFSTLGCKHPANCMPRATRMGEYLYHFLRRQGAIVTSPNGPARSNEGKDAKHKLELSLYCNCSTSAANAQNHDAANHDWAKGLQAILPEGWAFESSGEASGEVTTIKAFLPAWSTEGGDSWREDRMTAFALARAIGEQSVASGLSQVESAGEELPGSGRLRRIMLDISPPTEAASAFSPLPMLLDLAITNPSLCYTQMEIALTREGNILTGATNVPAFSDSVVDALEAGRIPIVKNVVTQLPERSRLGSQPFGYCRVRSVLTRTRPSESAGLQTELLFGEPVFLLDHADGYYLLLASDGYWGWAPEDAIAPLTGEQFNAYMALPEAVVQHDIIANETRIPRGARVRIAKSSLRRITIAVPGADSIAIIDRGLLKILANEQTQQAEARVLAAMDLLHTPYVFGGRSPDGLDCSGLMTSVAARTGESAARDAKQQILAGRLTATSWHRETMRAGDQVFFIDCSGKVYHTGIALDATHILHSAPPGVQIGSIVKGDRLYDTRLDRDFFVAKRP